MSTNAAVRASESATARFPDRSRTASALTLSEAVEERRPDLVEDTLLWRRLLTMAWLDHGDGDMTTYWALRYMRCCGMRLDTYDDGKPGYRMVPLLTKWKLDELDLEGDTWPDDSQWRFEHEYKKDREAVLMPHRDEVIHYLKKMWAEDMAEEGL
jgi:hypothetical protein